MSTEAIVEQLKRIADSNEACLEVCKMAHDRITKMEEYIMDRDGRDHAEHQEMRELELYIKRVAKKEWENAAKRIEKERELLSKIGELSDAVKEVRGEIKNEEPKE